MSLFIVLPSFALLKEGLGVFAFAADLGRVCFAFAADLCVHVCVYVCVVGFRSDELPHACMHACMVAFHPLTPLSLGLSLRGSGHPFS